MEFFLKWRGGKRRGFDEFKKKRGGEFKVEEEDGRVRGGGHHRMCWSGISFREEISKTPSEIKSFLAGIK